MLLRNTQRSTFRGCSVCYGPPRLSSSLDLNVLIQTLLHDVTRQPARDIGRVYMFEAFLSYDSSDCGLFELWPRILL
jgi:hypothetical protein